MIIRMLAAIAVSAAACLPAAAQYDDAANINAAFERGKTSGGAPEDVNERWTCAAFWYVWSEFVESEFDAAMRAKLDPALTKPRALEASAYWETQATRHLGMATLDPETEAYIDRQVNMAWGFGEGVVMGENYTLVGILGSCAVPAEELERFAPLR